MAGLLLVAATTRSQEKRAGKAQFLNVTKSAGITFVHTKGKPGAPMILAEMAPGVCVGDFDGDGWPDFYIVNGGDLGVRGSRDSNALYHNNGDGTFTDLTTKAGVPGTSYGLGCVWGDYDNDGHPDLYVSQYGEDILYHNNGNGTFTDVTVKAGVGATELGTSFHSGATFFDYDRDGLLDLYVGGYVTFGTDSPQSCIIYGITTSCAPSAYNGSANALYHNNGDGTFTNVTKESGLFTSNGKNLSVGAADYDNDGWPDLFVANDGQSANLYHNERNGSFKDIGLLAGMAVGGQGGIMAGMCISLGDYDNDGWLDLYISDWQGSSDHLWKNDGKGGFDEMSHEAGITRATLDHLSFGGGFLDYDNDGLLDLFIANGHVFPGIERSFPRIHYKQTNTLLHNEGKMGFIDMSSSQGQDWQIPNSGRGAAFADFDNSGNLNILVGNGGAAPSLWRNQGRNGNHFINIKLIGTKSNRDAIGARVRIEVGGVSLIQEVEGGGSYLSQSDLRLHFGLGAAREVQAVQVMWPSGAHQEFNHMTADKFYLIEEGQEEVKLQYFAGHHDGTGFESSISRDTKFKKVP
ncbi:ASPIC/UnbV domain protein [Acidisarcina polymorpha]|uniref:ASPIC/UnbV domain protein n=1 Tax=Acidisarcina polymorpha TaxID=2211140 RepID=A0A2Z5G547_9BACT|nr:CRTAC1 family protein [Acidisarcina polymorpha]AXC13897.1 ASPIC/UnbV domain protein [Acidisarcina polymorpha]